MGIPALTTTSPSVLGAMMIESAIFFEASSAELVGAEGQKLQFLNKAVSNNPAALTNANKGIQDTLAALSNLEGAILKKIAAGTHFICNGFCD